MWGLKKSPALEVVPWLQVQADFDKREAMQKENSIFLKGIVNPMLLRNSRTLHSNGDRSDLVSRTIRVSRRPKSRSPLTSRPGSSCNTLTGLRKHTTAALSRGLKEKSAGRLRI